jgi:DedD protein
MPRTVSDEEIQLRKRARRRLVGAIALVTLAVVVLPMALDPEPKPVSHDIAINIPPRNDAGPFASKVAPSTEAPKSGSSRPAAEKAAPAPGADTAAKARDSAPAAGDTSAARTGTAVAQEARVAKTEAPKISEAVPRDTETAAEAKSAGETAATQKPAAKADSFVVQLDAFSNPANARQQQQKLAAAGVPSYTELIKTEKGELTRVRVGPYTNREAADTMRDRLKTMGVNAVVVPK